MAKIGRNQPCPCGSGQKYKRCCLTAENIERQQQQAQAAKVSLISAIERIQQAAEKKVEEFYELGVFVFFSNSDGDAWLLEVTDQDAVQVAAGAEALKVPVEENSETIEMNWSHTFEVREKQFHLTSYEDKSTMKLDNVPTQKINAAMRRVMKRYSREMLDQVHVPQESEA